MTASILLLGDSVFDNAAYTAGEPDVATHLGRLLPESRVTLCAVDGATTGMLAPQLQRVPEGATHLVLSIGGNDVLESLRLPSEPCLSVGDALDRIELWLGLFEENYSRALESVLALGLPTTVCTIYNGRFERAEAGRLRTLLAVFDDAILRQASRRSLGVIELRHVCTEPEDYVLKIEPSATGGLKIAQAIAHALAPPSSVGVGYHHRRNEPAP